MFKKMKGGSLGTLKNFLKKGSQCQKQKGDPLVSPGIIFIARYILISSCGLKENSHWYSGVSLHEVPTKKPTNCI